MKEVRAVVIGLAIVVLVAMAWAFWHRPAREFHKIRGYRVEIQKTEGGDRKHLSFSIPIVTLARIASRAVLRAETCSSRPLRMALRTVSGVMPCSWL